MLQQALLLTLMYWIVIGVDGFTSLQTIQRPIIMAAITGFVLGNLTTGIIMGGLLEAVFMGISGVGGSKPAQPQVSTVFCVALVILTKVDIAVAIALALPFGVMASSINNVWKPVYVLFEPYFEKLALQGKSKQFTWAHYIFNFTIRPSGLSLILFLSLWLGVNQAEVLMAKIPPNVMNGITAAGNLLPVVGYGILAYMLWTKNKHMLWLFLGFLLATYLKLPTLAIAGLGIIIAVATFMRDLELRNMSDQMNKKPIDEKEEFLNA